MYIEAVQNNFKDRSRHCIKKKELGNYYTDNVPLYRSTYMFVSKFRNITDYMGKYDIDYIILDIDKGHYTDEELKEVVISYLMDLDEMEIDQYNRLVFYSGTGYHILFNADYFGFKISEDLPRVVRSTISEIFPKVDSSVFTNNSIYRVANSINQKVGRYKIPLHEEELHSKSVNDIIYLSRRPRFDFDYEMYELNGDGSLKSKIIKPRERNFKKGVKVNRIATCVHNIEKKGAVKGSRHNDMMVLTSHFRRKGIPLRMTIDAVLDWFHKGDTDGMADKEARNHIIDIYEKNYTFSCNHPLLKKHCSPMCIYYNTEGYKNDVYDYQEMHEIFDTFRNTNFDGNILRYDKLLGVDNNIISYPGDLVCMVGLPGAGKTAFLQQMTAGIPINSGERRTLGTLYISTEMSARLMYARWVQQVNNMTRDEVLKNVENPEKDLSHILLREETLNVDEIERLINKYVPKMVVVDYLELIKSNEHNATQKIRSLSRNLKELAKRYKIIMVMVSQVSRQYARKNVLSLQSGYGSSGLEKDADMFLGLWGQTNNSYKKLEFFKIRDAAPPFPKIYLKQTDSFRFKESTEEEYDEHNPVDNIFD